AHPRLSLRPPFPTRRSSDLVLCALLALPAVWSAPAPGRQTPKAAQRVHQENRATTRNPHGPTLTIPCDNCHKVSAWRPIKANPEDRKSTRLNSSHVSISYAV